MDTPTASADRRCARRARSAPADEAHDWIGPLEVIVVCLAVALLFWAFSRASMGAF
ncbi:hypothetical protein QBC42DRAFT_282595 [Cladorrhinum samala]|uniref:Uncharacterized protein n=1 Tax=Cladorrhinum samala TaxID=585594 RepID=A0AAV9HZD6_9PEZI|nr:hypothetical protein QBC42DRAFT_282595 [Cladorrhinum samala]